MRPHVIRRYVTQMIRINLCLYLIKIKDLQNVKSVFWVDTIIKSCGNTTIQLMDIYEYTYYICTHCKIPSLKDLRLTRELSNIVTNYTIISKQSILSLNTSLALQLGNNSIWKLILQGYLSLQHVVFQYNHQLWTVCTTSMRKVKSCRN